MAASAGYKAIVQIGASPVTITGIKSVEIQIGLDIYDITDLNNNQWKLKLAGLADYTLKFSGNYDLSDAQQTALQAAIITNPGATVNWNVFPAGTGTGAKSYSGTALVKQMNPKFSVSSESQVDFDLEGSGAIVYA